MSIKPDGTTHIDTGPGLTEFLRITDNLHDYWCAAEKRWVTFEGGHNTIHKHWQHV